MKKNLLIIFVTFLSVLLFAQEKFSLKYGAVVSSDNHSYLTEEYVGSEITIKGRVSVNKNTFVLQENPDSKSVVTFNLEVKKWILKRKLRKLNGQTVTVTGELTEAASTWKKGMKVLQVE